MEQHDDLNEIARELAMHSAKLRARQQTGVGEEVIVAAKRYQQERMRRPALPGHDDPAVPAWNILIELYLAAHEGRNV